jgi:hypothetical protein
MGSSGNNREVDRHRCLSHPSALARGSVLQGVLQESIGSAALAVRARVRVSEGVCRMRRGLLTGVRVFCFFYRSTHYSGFDEASATGEPADPDQSRSRDRR